MKSVYFVDELPSKLIVRRLSRLLLAGPSRSIFYPALKAPSSYSLFACLYANAVTLEPPGLDFWSTAQPMCAKSGHLFVSGTLSKGNMEALILTRDTYSNEARAGVETKLPNFLLLAWPGEETGSEARVVRMSA